MLPVLADILTCGRSVTTALLLLYLLLLASGSASAQPAGQPLSYEAWDRSDGLAQSAVTALAAAEPGYLFVGTQGGLSRFDGARFVNFPPAGSFEERPFVTSLAEHGETVWVGSRRGLLRYQDGVLEKAVVSGLLRFSYVRSLKHTSAGLLVGLSRGGLRVLSDDQTLSVDGADHGTFRAIAKDARDRLLAASEDGLYEVTSEPFWRAERLLSGVNVRAIAGRDDTTCVGADSGALLCETQTGDFEELHRLEAPITALQFGSDGRLWIATNGAGVWIKQGESVRPIPSSLPIKFSFALFSDASDNIWVGSRRGLVRLQPARVSSFGEQQGLPDDFVRTVFQDGDRLWVGTGAGLAVADWPFTGRFDTVKLDPAQAGIQVRALHRQRDGSLIVGTRSGVQALTSSGQLVGQTIARLADDTVNAFSEEQDGTLWIATSANGAWRRSTDGELSQVLPGTTVRALLSSTNGTWIGSERGLWRYADGTLSQYEALDPSSIVLSLAGQMDDGGLWVGTAARGVYKIREGGQLEPRSAMFEGPVFSINQIGDFLWLSTSTGISRVATSELSDFLALERESFATDSWDESSGMASSESNGGSQPAAWVDGGNTLWVATIGGVVAVDTDMAVPEMRVVPTWIEELRFDGVEIPFDSRQLLELPPGKRNLDVTFTVSQYSSPSPITFRYRLHGFDDVWKEVGRQTRATFTNVPPGRYLFEVQASSGGVWQEGGASLALHLTSHLTERRAFWLVPSLLGFAGLLLAWRWRERDARRQRTELENLVEERTAALAIVNQELAGLARTDSLTGLANRRWFDLRLKEEWARAARGTPLSLLIFDLDDFKLVNDRFGHLAGDECLRLVARLISGEFRRAADFVARFGGEEFVAILPGADAQLAAERAQAVRSAIANCDCSYEGTRFKVTVSGGVATCEPSPGGSVDNVLESADQALYAAKEAGKNCVRSASFD